MTVPPAVALAATLIPYLVSRHSGDAFFLARVDPVARAALYIAVAGAAAALAGFVLAALAILLAMDPQRKLVTRLKAVHAWAPLLALLIAATTWLMLTIGVSMVAIAADSPGGRSAVELSFAFVSLAAFVSTLVGSLIFAAVAFVDAGE